MKFYEIINQNYSKLNENDIEICGFILKNQDKVSKMGIRTLAEEVHSSKSTIVRLAQKLNFSGYGELKNFLTWDNETNNKQMENMYLLPKLIEDHQKQSEMLKHINWQPLYQKLDKVEHIFLVPSGEAQKNIAIEFQRLFLFVGKTAQIISGHPSRIETKRAIEKVTEDDAVIFISLSGENKDIIQLAKVVNVSRAMSISLTRDTENSLSGLSTFSLYAVSKMQSSEFMIFGSETTSTFFTMIEAFIFGFIDFKGKK